jgi:hypothetical protein
MALIKTWKPHTPDDVFGFLNLRHFPGIIDTDQAALLLGLAEHDTAIAALAQNPDRLL